MGFHGDLAEAFAGADDQGEGQGRVARGDVHHGAAGEIQDAQGAQPAALAPDPVGQGIIHQGHPDEAEEQKRLEAHPFHKGAGDQGRGDHREHHLEGGKEPVGDGLGIVRVGQGPHPVEPQKVEPADQPADIGAEGQGVAVQDPLDPGQGHKDVTQGQGGKQVLPAHHAPVKQGQGRSHQQDQRAAHQQPGGVAGINGPLHAVTPFNTVISAAKTTSL